MPLRQQVKNTHPLSKDVRQNIAFGAPLPGSSLTKEHGSAPFEHPPKFTKLSDAMNHMMDQLTEPFYLRKLLQLMDSGSISIEAIARTLIFTGFTTGMWTVDLGMLMYKPLMLSLLALAHRTGLKNTPVLVPRTLANYHRDKLKQYMIANKSKELHAKAMTPLEPPEVAPEVPEVRQGGFMSREK